jgi:hypothetical protein
LCTLAVTRDFIFCFATGVFNKVPSFTHFGLLKLPKIFGAKIPGRSLFTVKILKKFM